MKLCDRHFHFGDHVPAVNSVKFTNSHEVFDLCLSCSENLIQFIKEPKKNSETKIVDLNKNKK